MNRLGSEFYKQVKDYERNVVGGFTFRHLIFMLGIVLSAILSTVIILMGLPEILLYIILPVILIPFLIFGLKQEERLKEMVLFRLTIQERAYLTEFESEENYDKTAFWPEKGVREIYPIGGSEGETP